MGAKQTKIEGTYLSEASPATSIPELKRSSVQEDELDPRSPNGCRTPISTFYGRGRSTAPLQRELGVYQQHTPINFTENPLGMLRKRFLKGFVYNMNDPRSPSTHLNRTPLVFDDAVDKTLNLDDTFADLFVETRKPADEATSATEEAELESLPMQLPQSATDGMQVDDTEIIKEATVDVLSGDGDDGSSLEGCSLVCYEEETMACPAVLHQTPSILQPLDPRSPSFGLERTPIIFSDDDEAGEEAMLENILATLSLDLSSASSVLSFGTPTSTQNNALAVAGKLLPTKSNLPNKNMATNKHLERVRVGKKHLPPRKLTRGQRQRIYEDCENVLPAQSSTPKNKSNGSNVEKGGDSGQKRTPLSCVKNRAHHLRSRSVETSSAKSLKARLSLTSFDDSLNPMQNAKVANMRILQDSQESL